MQDGTWLALGTIGLAGAIGATARFQTGNANQWTAFEAIKAATIEIWITRPGYGRRTLAGTYLEDIDLWLHDSYRDARPTGAIASVSHEYATAPPEPYTNQVTLNTWNRVGDRASELFGREIYIESINPAFSEWFFV